MRTILVHSRTPIMNLDPRDPTPLFAHCFGPFDSPEDAEAFDILAPDSCYKTLLPIIGPEPQDLDAALDLEATNRDLKPVSSEIIQ